MLKNILSVLVALGVSVATFISGNVAPGQNSVSNNICLLPPPAPTTCLPVKNPEFVNPYLLKEMSENRNDPTHCPTDPRHLAYLSQYYECMPGNIECLSSAILENMRIEKFPSGAVSFDDKYDPDYALRIMEHTYHSNEGRKEVHDADRRVLNLTLSNQCHLAGQPFEWNQNSHDNANNGVFVKDHRGNFV